MLAAVPAFDPNKVATCRYGESDAAIAAGTSSYGANTTARTLFARWRPVPITEPCELHLTKLVHRLNLGGTLPVCDQVEFILVTCRPEATSGPAPGADAGTEVYYKLLGTGPWSASATLTWNLTEMIALTSAMLTGKRLWGSVAVRKAVTAANAYVGDTRMNFGVGPNKGWSVGDRASVRDALAATQGSTGYSPLWRIEFTTKTRKLFSFPTKDLAVATFNDLHIVQIIDQAQWIKFGGITGTAAGSVVGCDLKYVNDSVAAATLGGVLLNFGGDTVGFGSGATRNTYPMGAGAQDEAHTNARDLYIAQKTDGANEVAELFDVNRTTGQGPLGAGDRALIAHGVAFGGARDNPITLAAARRPDHLVMPASAAGACASLEIGWEPLVIFGDSRAGQMWAPPQGDMPGQFTQPRIEIGISIDGNRIAYDAAGLHTSMKDRYKHATLTRHADVCELTHYGVVFGILGGPGTNDAVFRAAQLTTPEARATEVDIWLAVLAAIIDDVLANGSEVTLCIGPSAHTGYATFSADMRAAMDYLAVQLRALAITKTITALDAHAIAHRDQDTYLQTISVHYTDAGRALIAGLHADAYEYGGLPEITATAESGGTIGTILDDPYYLAYGGDTVAITATPDAHYVHDDPKWAGDVPVEQANDMPLTRTGVIDDETFEAQFFLVGTPVVLEPTDVGTDRFTARWEAVEGADGYVIAGVGFEDVYVEDGEAVSQEITGLSPGTTYWYTIHAYIGEESGEASEPVEVTTLVPTPTATAATDITAVSFSANWETLEVEGFELDVATDEAFTAFVEGFEALDVEDALTYSVEGLEASTIYYYRVRAYIGEHISENSNTISATTSSGGRVNIRPSLERPSLERPSYSRPGCLE